MLLEEGIDEKINSYCEEAAIRQAEKPFFLSSPYYPSASPTSCMLAQGKIKTPLTQLMLNARALDIVETKRSLFQSYFS